MKIITNRKLSCFDYPTYRYGSDDTISKIVVMCHEIREVFTASRKKSIVLFVTGTSGIFIATHIQMYFCKEIPVIILYVNKKDETRHTNDLTVESVNKRNSLTFFVDDFIHSGNTMMNVFKKVNVSIDGICVSGRVYKDTTIDYLSDTQKRSLKFLICSEYLP